MILDLFAGPGGWDVAAQQLGLDPLGVEMDAAARQTRHAAGLRTSHTLNVREVDLSHLQDTVGLIASPPCQTFSMAGKGAGRVALEQVLHGVKRVAAGEPIPYDEYDDLRTGLVLEPLRYALELEPDWVAWEQVPTVQPVWDACAEVLRQDGYSVWTGHLHAETYGVPQTRKRSLLIASRSREMSKPPATHSRFYSRSPARLDDGACKWVSMAEALGWDASDRVISNYGTGGDPRNRGERSAEHPSATVTSKVDRNVVLRSPQTIVGMLSAGGNNTAGQMLRTPEMPSATMTGKGTAYWQQPTPAIKGDTQDDVQWVYDRPSPTIVGSFAPDVVAAPGYRTTVSWQNAKGSVRVTVQEAAILQSFPADYPWQGSKTKQYQQVGNAIPPLLALHILAHVTGVEP